MLIPSARAHHDPHHGEHDRHFDEHADDRRERGARLKAKQRDRRATASSKKFDAPIKADGQATLCGTPRARLSP
jgi:hypothetical protein